jgi:hypothetical protein
MLHIHVILAGSDAEAVTVLRKYKSKIRQIFADHLRYEMGTLALIPRLLTEPEVELSDNLDRIEFVVDTGSETPRPGESAVFIQAELLEEIPELRTIKFGVLMRKVPDNSYSKHTVS